MNNVYTAEDQKQIEHILDVFKDYIKAAKHLDIVKSEKAGYIYMDVNPIRKTVGESNCFAIQCGEMIVRRLAYDMAVDTMEEVGHCLDPYEATPLEQAEIRKRLLPYLLQLPEYRHLLETPKH